MHISPQYTDRESQNKQRVYSLRARFIIIPACIFRNLNSVGSVSVKQFE